MGDLNSIKVKELHALCSYIKCDSSERSLENIMAMRDLCGGHGYSVYS